jgi:hypothetical protein
MAITCSVCGRSLTSKAGLSMVAWVIDVDPKGDERVIQSFREIYPELKDDHYHMDICFICVMRAFGIPIPYGR